MYREMKAYLLPMNVDFPDAAPRRIHGSAKISLLPSA
jgi:hypothetical protein